MHFLQFECVESEIELVSHYRYDSSREVVISRVAVMLFSKF